MSGPVPSPEDVLTVLDVPAVRRLAVLVRSALAARRAEIDALNVFPVPDGDTGTNLYLTVDGAVERALAAEAEGAAGALSAADQLSGFAASLLWTARGNSGVILSQFVRGLAEGCGGASTVDAAVLARGLQRADARAWEGVSEPKEGTILSVSRAAAEAAVAHVDEGLYAVSAAALDAARDALARTPEQLAVLARAGVVDAGGAGLVVVFECLERLCAGDDAQAVLRLRLPGRRPHFPVPVGARPMTARPAPAAEDAADDATGAARPGPEYEVMYLLADSTDEAVQALRARLVALGDSVLVVGGDGLWNVHAHVDDPGAAVEAGVEAGRPHRIRITTLLGDGDHPPASAPRPAAPVSTSGVVACAAGAGLADVFREAGAVVVPSGPRRRASTGQLIAAIREQHASGVSGVVVLPNDDDTALSAAAAARAVADEGIEAHVVRARTAVQGIAAIAVFDPCSPVAANVLAMQSAASATRHGAVTVADRRAMTSGGPCAPGDALGIVDGDIVLVGSDQEAVAVEVVSRLLSSGGELLTVLRGEDATDALLDAIARAARRQRPDLEVARIDGGQTVYPVLLGVE
ncbi:MAG TPA: DAK2 domain-containing protein [Intrasporangium sp.]|uniref:DAK2 domain-containing protein n=1 Tax=Intrasporangium sp. TaxID=1925024 RepID=UPI002D7901FB|nr:DAK2 domain-containing protein [Intrasporangium sp.]HET7399244.1 DAK2 domain-containing protein [Intrasporangium sp.]